MSSLHAYTNNNSAKFAPFMSSSASDAWDMSFRGSSERSFVPSPQSFYPANKSPYSSDMWSMEKTAKPHKSPKDAFIEINSSSRGIWSGTSSSGVMAIPKKAEERSAVVGSSPSAVSVVAGNIEEEITGQNLYKTELCRSFEESGACRYGSKCQFAHGRHEIRQILRHPKYKTEVCKTFQNEGVCPYGLRCRFIHNVSESGVITDAQSTSPPPPSQQLLLPQPKPKSAAAAAKPKYTPVNMYNKSAAPFAPRGFISNDEWSTSWSPAKVVSSDAVVPVVAAATVVVPHTKRDADKRLAIFQHLTEDN